MKVGGPWYSLWMFFSRITFPCPSVCPPPPGLPWTWKILRPVDLSRGDMLVPNGSIIFCPTSWNAHVMTGTWNSHVRPELSSIGGRCDKKEVSPHLCGESWIKIIWKRIEIVLHLRQCYLGFDYSHCWTCNRTLRIADLCVSIFLTLGSEWDNIYLRILRSESSDSPALWKLWSSVGFRNSCKNKATFQDSFKIP